VRTGRNFSPARNVRSITAPSEARRNLVRTNAPPLPGFTCWNSTILKIVPSTSMWLPFLNWLVLIRANQSFWSGISSGSQTVTVERIDHDSHLRPNRRADGANARSPRRLGETTEELGAHT